MNKLNNHTRNQRRMYRIHKLEEKIKEQELIIGSLKEQLEKERKARKEAVEYINGTGEIAPYTKSIVMYEQEIEELLEILDIDKGE